MNVGGYNLWPLGGGVQGGKNRGSRDNTFYAFTGRMYLQTIASSTAINSTAAATAFDQHPSIPKGLLNIVGARLTVAMWGHYGTTGTPSLQVNIRLDDPTTGDLLAAHAIAAMPNNAAAWGWFTQASCIVRALGGSGTLQPAPGTLTVSNNTTGIAIVNQVIEGTITSNTNTAHPVYGIVTWGAADPANTIIVDGMSIEVDYPYTTTP